MSDQNSESIQRLRHKFLAESESNPQLYNPIDVERVKTEDWQLERFILDNNSEEKAYKELTRVLKWKNSYGLYERSDEYFPKEFFLIFCHETYSHDKSGHIVTWNIENRYMKIGELSHLIQQFLCHQLEKLDRAAGPNGWLSVNDCRNAGLANVDMNISKFRTDQLNQYPKSIYKSLNVDMPWVLSSAYKIIKGFLSKNIRDSLFLIKRDEITEYVDIDLVPECFGGKRKCTLDSIKHLKPLHECKHLELNQKVVDTFYNTYKQYFQRH